MFKKIKNINEVKDFIAKGKNRSVYFHPSDRNLCLKIQHNINSTENYIDKKYYTHLINRKVSFAHIAEFVGGEVNTNKGDALIFVLMRDFDGEVSKTLEYYLAQNDKAINNIIIEQLNILKQYLIKERILFVDVSPENIVLRKINNNTCTLIIVDALSSRNVIPISHYFRYFAIKMIYRRWDRCMKSRYTMLDL
jgi:hypothetical protein